MATGAMETAIDRMVDLIQARGGMGIGQVAKELRMGEAQVEEIANVLSDSGMIRIKYTLTGIFVEPNAAALKPKEKEKAVAEAKKRAGIRSLLSQVEAEIAQSETRLRPAQEEAARRMKKVEGLLAEIEKQERNASEEELKSLRMEALGLEKGMRRVGGEMQAVEKQMDGLLGRIREIEGRASKREEDSPKPAAQKTQGLLGRLSNGIQGIFRRKKGG